MQMHLVMLFGIVISDFSILFNEYGKRGVRYNVALDVHMSLCLLVVKSRQRWMSLHSSKLPLALIKNIVCRLHF